MAEDIQPQAKWGMVIDLDLCSGCQACVTACAMENNIHYVGEDEVAYGRSLHWLFTMRYWRGHYPDVTPEYQLNLCQQCGNAPCEPVCPVFASAHSEQEQVNLQVYNRCIGTRYCANNCPYFVRVFNWFDYEIPEPLNNYLNPNVTVRRRGVMEKCTFCIHRIQASEQQAGNEGRAVGGDEVVTACAQACPTDAITFGRLDDPQSQVSQLARNNRRWLFLHEELGTFPRVIYLRGVGESQGEVPYGG
jgi:Fe-S-cluster-containing dehydrogenase component